MPLTLLSGLSARIFHGARRPANWLQLGKFAAVGASGYVINLVVFGLVISLGATHIPAALIAFCVAVTNNFWWNRAWTFKPEGGGIGLQASRFFTVSVAALGVNLIVLSALVTAGLSELPAQAIAVGIATPVNFVGNRLWTFGASLEPAMRPPGSP